MFKQKNKTTAAINTELANQISQVLSSSKRTTENPVIKASQIWSITSNQLYDFLGDSIFNQWFKDIVPIVVLNNILILQTKNRLTSHWINNHYQALVDTLIGMQDKKLTSFFISPSDRQVMHESKSP
ncbi:MAG: hypothetical protein JNM93_07325 [Bacteriovoracaceae bacterium]|nr:hypothetical protein [Bacteriovoracaceae bacterium]